MALHIALVLCLSEHFVVEGKWLGCGVADYTSGCCSGAGPWAVAKPWKLARGHAPACCIRIDASLCSLKPSPHQIAVTASTRKALRLLALQGIWSKVQEITRTAFTASHGFHINSNEMHKRVCA